MIQAGKKGLLASTLANRTVEPLATDFDGTNDYLSRSSDLSGNSDGKTFTFSAWVYHVSNNSMVYEQHDTSNQYLYIFIGSTGNLTIVGHNAANAQILNVTGLQVEKNTWTHILVSIDMANTSNRYVYLNDEDASPTWTTYTNDDIAFDQSTRHGIAGRYNGSFGVMEGRLAHVFLDYTYRDLSVTANRRDFITADLRPASSNSTLTGGIIYLPLIDATAPGTNEGTGGDFTLNGTIARSGRGPNQYNPAASTFDGSADYLSRGSALSGASDGKNLTYSVLLKLDAAPSGEFVYRTTSNISGIRVLSGGDIRIENKDTVGGDALEFQSSGSPLVVGKWHHLTCSFDMTDTGNRHVLLDGNSISGTYNFYTNTTLDFTNTNQYVGSGGATAYFPGEISDFWFDTTYIDLSTDNPFYDTATGKAKDLGVDGSTPTGSAPLIYLPMRGDDAGSNNGTGGDFTVNSGPYAGARGPSEFWAGSAEFNGTDQYLSRGSLAGIADGGIISIAFAVKPDTVTGTQAILDFEVSGVGERFTLTNSTGDLRLIGTADGGTVLLNATVSSAFSAGSWLTGLIHVDLSNASLRGIYLDGLAATVTWTTYTSGNIDFTGDAYGVAARSTSPGDYFDGKIGFLWFNTEYIDFSQEANRLKFFDAFGYPVDLGADGSTPTGNVPLIYMNNGFHLGTNLGSGGNFTPQNTPTDGGFVKG